MMQFRRILPWGVALIIIGSFHSCQRAEPMRPVAHAEVINQTIDCSELGFLEPDPKSKRLSYLDLPSGKFWANTLDVYFKGSDSKAAVSGYIGYRDYVDPVTGVLHQATMQGCYVNLTKPLLVDGLISDWMIVRPNGTVRDTTRLVVVSPTNGGGKVLAVEERRSLRQFDLEMRQRWDSYEIHREADGTYQVTARKKIPSGELRIRMLLKQDAISAADDPKLDSPSPPAQKSEK